MSAQNVSETWSQGTTLATRTTTRWAQEEWERNQVRERCMVFAGFTPIDDGRSRHRIAVCERPEYAARIVQCVNAHDALVAALRAGRAYRDALAQCANDPSRMSSFCTAEGDDLDAVFARWEELSEAAITKVTQAQCRAACNTRAACSEFGCAKAAGGTSA